ncbi:unnamed protein product [Linum tenue]|uniref:AB hydrolase-1 domain-containing protein n=2 Tax=Linum tenue TaxID=586396 RepID=A0AAV0KRC4_9ROSI|nr:unnamed protein product [Linum tenue]
MAPGSSRKIYAASARSHTRRAKQSSGLTLPSGIFPAVLLVLLAGLVSWGYQAVRPPLPKICGSSDGPPVTASRIQLRDGRHLAYQERGVSKDVAKIKVVFIHGLDVCRLDDVIAIYTSPVCAFICCFGLSFVMPSAITIFNILMMLSSQELVEELGMYFVSYDRPGYGESDPHPSRTVKSQALDIEELADQLGLGPKFYLIGYSLGGQLGWGCLKYIPHRLAGVTLLTPATNYYWPGFPSNLSTEAFYKQPPCDYWSLRVAHYAPWLTHWWNTQKWFPIIGAISKSPHTLSREDKEVAAKQLIAKGAHHREHVRQQGQYESLHRDLNLGFGTWEFDPVEMENPFMDKEVSVHLWQGDEDILVPATLQRYIAERHSSWIQYHELAGSGHFFPHLNGMADSIVKTMLNEKQ